MPNFRFSGAALKQYRVRAGQSRLKLAAAADTSIPTVWRYENNEAEPRAATLCRLAAALGVEPGDLFERVP